MKIALRPVGVVHSRRQPAEDDNWGEIVSEIELDANQFTPESLLGPDEFSHAEVLFLFHRVAPDEIEKAAGIREAAGTCRERASLRSGGETDRTGWAPPSAES